MKTGCNVSPETKARHAALTMEATLQLPAWSREVALQRVLGHNDQFGTCAIVAAVMAALTWWARRGKIITDNLDALVLEIYSAVTGFDPSKTDANGYNPTDNGTDPEKLFAWWQENPILGLKLKSFTRINPANINALKNAISSTGGVYLCVELTPAQVALAPWHPEDGGTEGHAIYGDQYIAQLVDVTSWGGEIPADDPMIAKQAVAAFVLELEAV
jgi:hypothetical protein